MTSLRSEGEKIGQLLYLQSKCLYFHYTLCKEKQIENIYIAKQQIALPLIKVPSFSLHIKHSQVNIKPSYGKTLNCSTFNQSNIIFIIRNAKRSKYKTFPMAKESVVLPSINVPFHYT